MPARQLALQRSAEDQRGNAKNNDEQLSEEKDKNGKATEGIDNEGRDYEGRDNDEKDNEEKDNDEQNNCALAVGPSRARIYIRDKTRPVGCQDGLAEFGRRSGNEIF